ncbi:hypothetical protein AKO1_013708 [Acrasis kona]|uniref:Pentatricopeptide repeat-containing protein n=1 Tax=Acrasis kona TaxID=1008807 RepID=A0AAW2ZI99_9EUKA
MTRLTPSLNCFRMLLSACSYQSNVSGADTIYQLAKSEYGVGQQLNIYMIDVYARGGRLDEAERLAKGVIMKHRSVAWMTVLAGCKKYGDYERMQRIQKEN